MYWPAAALCVNTSMSVGSDDRDKRSNRVPFPSVFTPTFSITYGAWLLLPLPHLAFISEAGGLEPGSLTSKKVSLGWEVLMLSQGGSGEDNVWSAGLHALEGPVLGVTLC